MSQVNTLVIDDPTREEIREVRQLPGPGVGTALLRVAGGSVCLLYLFTLVPPLLSPALDVAALTTLSALVAHGFLRITRRSRR